MICRVIFRLSTIPVLAKALLKLCPEHPLAQQGIVENNWASVQTELDDWIKRGEKNPGLLIVIGKKLTADKKTEKALELVKRACKLDPSFENYHELAGIYRTLNRMDDWQASLIESLNIPITAWNIL